MVMMRVRTVLDGVQGLPGLATAYFNGASSTPVAADATDVVGRVRAFWLAIASLIPAPVVYHVSNQVDLIDPADGQLVGGLAPAAVLQVAGTGGASGPAPVAFLLVLNTGSIVNGRRLQGRWFIAPAPASVNSAGSFGTAQQATLTAAAAGMLTGGTASVPVVWHRPKVTPFSPGIVAPVTGYASRTPFAVLRSRRD